MLIQGLRRIDPELCLPTVRSYVEKQLNLIAEGKQQIGDVVPYVLSKFYEKFKYYVRKIGLMVRAPVEQVNRTLKEARRLWSSRSWAERADWRWRRGRTRCSRLPSRRLASRPSA